MSRSKIDRRVFLQSAAVGALGAAGGGLGCKGFSRAPYAKGSKLTNKVFVLGFDGMDPVLLRRFVARGEMPTFQRLIESRHFLPQGREHVGLPLLKRLRADLDLGS